MIRHRLAAAMAITVGVALVAGTGLVSGRFEGVQRYWEDLLQPGLSSADDVVVVAIDRETIAASGVTWPWPRDLHAEIIEAIAAGEPSAVIYDVFFPSPREGDDALAAALDGTPAVLGAALTLAPQPDGPPRILELVPPTDQLAAAAADIGHLNITVAADRGVVRSLPLYAVDDRNIARASVVLAAVALAEGASGPLTERPDGVQIGSRFIPLDDGELRINWTEELDADDMIPAIDVVTGEVDPEHFRGRIVVVGATEPTLGDQHLIPLDRSGGSSGVIVMANAVNTILSNGYLSAPSQTRELLVIVAIAALVTALFVGVRLLIAALASLALIAAWVLFVGWRISVSGALWNLVWPVLAVLLAAAAGTGWRYFAETRHRRRAWRTFAIYVPASVVRQLEDPRRLASALEGARLEITVLFCDLRGFTPVAATLTPAQVRQLLDHYYDYAVRIVHDHGGTVMQFVGDEVFAVFGAPLPTPEAAADAVRCALALQRDRDRLDAALAADGLPPIRFGIGMNRGEVVAAHVGTSDRRQYSVMGDTVNVGSRLCSQAAAGEVVASQSVLAGAAPDDAEVLAPAGAVVLKGVAEPVPIFRGAPRTATPAETITGVDDADVVPASQWSA